MARNAQDRTEVSCCIKYLVFGFNIFFWFVGVGLLAIGIWAWAEKEMFDNLSKIASDGGFLFDPALIFIIVGAVVFIIGFTGCIGALRENTCLLLFFSICLGVIFFLELGVGILFFVYKDWFHDQIKIKLLEFIKNYRDDPDLQNLIDWIQADWLRCCGVNGPGDWDGNAYFNCSSRAREKCGVPFSCCTRPDPVPSDYIINKQCGYDTRSSGTIDGKVVYRDGCLDAGMAWLESNLIPVAGVAVGIAVIQILGICFAQNLRSDIFAQRAKWSRR